MLFDPAYDKWCIDHLDSMMACLCVNSRDRRDIFGKTTPFDRFGLRVRCGTSNKSSFQILKSIDFPQEMAPGLHVRTVFFVPLWDKICGL